MNPDAIEVSVILPRTLWEQLRWHAQAEQSQETNLLIRAIEEFLQHESAKIEMGKLHRGVHVQSLARQPRRKTSAMGKYAYLSGTTEDFLQPKQIDIASEDR